MADELAQRLRSIITHLYVAGWHIQEINGEVLIMAKSLMVDTYMGHNIYTVPLKPRAQTQQKER